MFKSDDIGPSEMMARRRCSQKSTAQLGGLKRQNETSRYYHRTWQQSLFWHFLKSFFDPPPWCLVISLVWIIRSEVWLNVTDFLSLLSFWSSKVSSWTLVNHSTAAGSTWSLLTFGSELISVNEALVLAPLSNRNTLCWIESHSDKCGSL